MSSDLKKVGLVFKADGTADFAKSLKQVNTLTQENYSAFKLAKSQWDSSTSSLKKLKDTQSYLSSQTEAYSSKVEVLNRELEELENAENRDEKAIAKKKNQLNNAQASLNKYKRGLEEVNAKLQSGKAQIDEYAKKVEAFANKTSKVGKTLSKNVTAPIVATGTAALKAWSEIDDAYDNIAAGTGATGDQLSKLQDSFDNVFSKVPSSAEDVSTSIADINTRFGFTGKALEDCSVSFLRFAKVNNIDVSSAIASVSKAINDAGIDSKDYGNVLDWLTSASQSSGLSVDVLANSLSQNGAQMRQLGFDTKDTIAFLATMEKNGVNTSTVLGGMKKAVQNFASEGKNAKEGLKETFDGIKNGSIDANAAMDVFGKKAGTAIYQYVKEGKLNFEDLQKVVENSSGQLNASYEAMKDPLDESKVAMNNLKLAGAKLGDEIQKTLGPIFQELADLLKDLTSWFKGLNDSTKEMIVKVGMIVAAVGPLLVVIGSIASHIASFMTMIGELLFNIATGQGLIGGLISTLGGLSAPLLVIIGMITATIGAIVTLWNESEGFRNAVMDIGTQIMGILQMIWSFLGPVIEMIKLALDTIVQEGIMPLWETFKEMIADVVTMVSWAFDIIGPIIDGIILAIGTLLLPVIQSILIVVTSAITGAIGMFRGLFSSISEICQNVTLVIQGIIDFIMGVFTGNWSRAWQGVVDIFGGIFGTIGSLCKAPINAIIGLLNGAIGGINTMIDGLNKINVTVPDWVPAIGGKSLGFNISHLGKIPYLFQGGDMLNGSAIVGDRGMELLTQMGNKTRVTPLTDSGGVNKQSLFDYKILGDSIASAFVRAGISVQIDKRELGKLIRSEAY